MANGALNFEVPFFGVSAARSLAGGLFFCVLLIVPFQHSCIDDMMTDTVSLLGWSEQMQLTTKLAILCPKTPDLSPK